MKQATGKYFQPQWYYILSGTAMPNKFIPLFITFAVNKDIFKRSCFFSSLSAVSTECTFKKELKVFEG